jgi:hypothetical protein
LLDNASNCVTDSNFLKLTAQTARTAAVVAGTSDL